MSVVVETSSAAKTVRTAVIIAGVLAIAFGVAILVWPTKTAVALTAVIAFYAIVAGIVYAIIGLISKTLGTGGRIGHVLLGVLYVVAGVFAFSELQASAAFLAAFLAVVLGVMWIIEGFVALFTLGRARSKVLTILFAIISVIAGVVLVTSPLWSALFLWWLAGISLVVLGVLNVVRAVAAGKD